MSTLTKDLLCIAFVNDILIQTNVLPLAFSVIWTAMFIHILKVVLWKSRTVLLFDGCLKVVQPLSSPFQCLSNWILE